MNDAQRKQAGVAQAPSSEDAGPSDARVRGDRRRPTADRILDAAMRVLGRKGARGTSMEDVAREAGVTRMTVYRHYASRDELMQAITSREMARYYQTVLARGLALEQAAVPGENPVPELLVDAIQYTLTHFFEHPVVNAIIENDPQLIYPVWTTRADGILRLGVGALPSAYERWKENGWIKPLPSEWIAEWITRLVMSWYIQPSPVVDLRDPKTVRRLVETFVWPALDPGGPAPRSRAD